MTTSNERDRRGGEHREAQRRSVAGWASRSSRGERRRVQRVGLRVSGVEVEARRAQLVATLLGASSRGRLSISSSAACASMAARSLPGSGWASCDLLVVVRARCPPVCGRIAVDPPPGVVHFADRPARLLRLLGAVVDSLAVRSMSCSSRSIAESALAQAASRLAAPLRARSSSPDRGQLLGGLRRRAVRRPLLDRCLHFVLASGGFAVALVREQALDGRHHVLGERRLARWVPSGASSPIA